jgi:hypothetical protein
LAKVRTPLPGGQSFRNLGPHNGIDADGKFRYAVIRSEIIDAEPEPALASGVRVGGAGVALRVLAQIPALVGPIPRGACMSLGLLPREFADLEPLVREWALTSEEARHRKRLASDLSTVAAFNERLHPRMDAIIAHLNCFSLDALPPEEINLLNLARAYMETSHPVDLGWSTTDLADAFPSERFEYLPPSSHAKE